MPWASCMVPLVIQYRRSSHGCGKRMMRQNTDCRSGEVRFSIQERPHGSTGPATRQQRTVLPWFVRVGDGHSMLVPQNLEHGKKLVPPTEISHGYKILCWVYQAPSMVIYHIRSRQPTSSQISYITTLLIQSRPRIDLALQYL